MTTRTPSDAAPSAIAAPEAKKKRRRRFMHRLPVYFVEHERMVGGSDSLKSRPEVTTTLGWVHSPISSRHVSRSPAGMPARLRKGTRYGRYRSGRPQATTRLEPPGEQPGKPPDVSSVF